MISDRASRLIGQHLARTIETADFQFLAEPIKDNAQKVTVTMTFYQSHIDALGNGLRSLGPDHIVILEEKEPDPHA